MADRVAVSGLTIRADSTTLVDDVSFSIDAGQVVGLVGASGSGKTLTARALMGLVDVHPGVTAAELVIRVGSAEHRPYKTCLGRRRGPRDKAFQSVRGDLLGYLPQDSRAALDPLMKVGTQVRAAARDNDNASDAHHYLVKAGFSNPDRIARLYPHELSGGMAQRAVIAQTLARGSRFLLADEPTTGLDPTVRRSIVRELRVLADGGIGVLFITHDLRLLPGFADVLLVMHGGRLVEQTVPEALRLGTMESDAGQRLVDATRRIAGGNLG